MPLLLLTVWLPEAVRVMSKFPHREIVPLLVSTQWACALVADDMDHIPYKKVPVELMICNG